MVRKKNKKRKKVISIKQQRFIDYYVDSGDGKESAIKAGYSPKSASIFASRLLTNDNILSEVIKKKDSITKKIMKKSEINLEKLVRELAPIAFSDMANIAEWNGDGVNMFDSAKLKEGISKTVKKLQSVENTRFDQMGKEKGRTVKINLELHDKLKAIEMIAKLLGLIVDKKELTGANGDPIVVAPVDSKAITSMVMELMEREGREFD